MTKVHAIIALRPNAKFVLQGDDITWLDEEQTQPTEEEIAQKIAELEYVKEVEVYKLDRQESYPSTGEQFDKIFHEGIDAWKAEIQAIKDAHPKAEADTVELENRKSTALFNYRLEKYEQAIARLNQIQLSRGQSEITETVVVGQRQVLIEDGENAGLPLYDPDTNERVYEDITESVVTQKYIEPLPANVTVTSIDEDGNNVESEVANPAITEDNAERAEAQAVVDATPQSVIDTYNE
jgi:hypothetical protein